METYFQARRGTTSPDVGRKVGKGRRNGAVLVQLQGHENVWDAQLQRAAGMCNGALVMVDLQTCTAGTADGSAVGHTKYKDGVTSDSSDTGHYGSTKQRVFNGVT